MEIEESNLTEDDPYDSVDEGIRNIIQETQNPQRITTAYDRDAYEDPEESHVLDSPVALRRETPRSDSNFNKFHKRGASLADRQENSYVESTSTHPNSQWENKEKQFKQSWID